MNLLLLKPEQATQQVATVSGRQLENLLNVQRAQVGDSVRIGLINGLMGQGLIKTLSTEQATIEISLDTPPPPVTPLCLILALPRPKMLRRTLQSVAAMGVKDIYLVNSSRVEKSFWQSPFLQPQAIEEQLILGLEQARDTLMPKLHMRKRFKPFVEDELGDIIKGRQALLAHPVTDVPCPIN